MMRGSPQVVEEMRTWLDSVRVSPLFGFEGSKEGEGARFCCGLISLSGTNKRLEDSFIFPLGALRGERVGERAPSSGAFAKRKKN